MNDKLINIQNLNGLIDPEPYFLISGLVLLAWFFYKFFLASASEERHLNLRTHFKSIWRHFLVLSTFFSAYIFLNQFNFSWSQRSLVYVGLISLLSGMIVFVKTSRLLILQYLFLGSMRAGVPVLIVNIFSLLLSCGLALWSANYLFGIHLAPLLATSAAASIILGLAIQDTLGNLFAGIALQLDKSYEIGDWIEVTSGIQKSVGQVKEISWRATALIGLSDEIITLPNRFISGAQIANFSNGTQPIVRSQSFRVDFDQNPNRVKECLDACVKNIRGIAQFPEPFSYISESTENGVNYKLVYYISDYGTQWGVGDRVVNAAVQALNENKIPVTAHKIKVINTP